MNNDVLIRNVTLHDNIEESLTKSIYLNAARRDMSLRIINVNITSSEKNPENKQTNSIKIVLSTDAVLNLTNIT